MAKKVRAIIISGNGVNCEQEMALACRRGGADVVDIVHIGELLAGRAQLEDYHFLNFPGGFLDGDDLGSAKAGANRILHAAVRDREGRLAEQVQAFIADKKLIIGVCNGFQLMVKMGLLPALEGRYGDQSVTLTFNDCGRFEDRWTSLKVDPASPCVYTRGLENLYFPVRHGEGKFVVRSSEVLDQLEEKHLAVLKYTDPDFQAPTMEYPFNPNGSVGAVAGICDESGRLFGLMPHPEAYLYRTHHPRWTREPDLGEEGMGVGIFRNAVEYIRSTLL